MLPVFPPLPKGKLQPARLPTSPVEKLEKKDLEFLKKRGLDRMTVECLVCGYSANEVEWNSYLQIGPATDLEMHGLTGKPMGYWCLTCANSACICLKEYELVDLSMVLLKFDSKSEIVMRTMHAYEKSIPKDEAEKMNQKGVKDWEEKYGNQYKSMEEAMGTTGRDENEEGKNFRNKKQWGDVRNLELAKWWHKKYPRLLDTNKDPKDKYTNEMQEAAEAAANSEKTEKNISVAKKEEKEEKPNASVAKTEKNPSVAKKEDNDNMNVDEDSAAPADLSKPMLTPMPVIPIPQPKAGNASASQTAMAQAASDAAVRENQRGDPSEPAFPRRKDNNGNNNNNNPPKAKNPPKPPPYPPPKPKEGSVGPKAW